jgi:hypothetical protein
MSSVENDLASLQRVLDRLKSTKNENLSAVLSVLLPKLLPLSNQDALRSKALAVISEAMKRVKLCQCPLALSPIISCIRPELLPFAANMVRNIYFVSSFFFLR